MLPKEKTQLDLKREQWERVKRHEVRLEIVWIFNMADAGRRELEGPDGWTIV